MPNEPRLPTERDYNPWNDAKTDWQNFGNLTLDEAYAKFCEAPSYYQEDFMFMGGIAFASYFEVIEKYIKNAHEIDSEFGDPEAWILAEAIQNQFDGDSLPHVQHLRERVVALSTFVHEHIDRFGDDDTERNRVADAWSELANHVTP